MSMIKFYAIKVVANYLIFLSAIATFSGEIAAQEPPQPSRANFLQQIALEQMRIQALGQARPATSSTTYALEKARCWIDLSHHESLRNNPTELPGQALRKAQNIIEALESKQVPSAQALDSELLSSATPSTLVPKMRPDLWQQLEAIKATPQLACAAQAVACGEVMLVQAAHAHERIDWRYSRPYFGMAEDLLRTARQQALNCKPSP